MRTSFILVLFLTCGFQKMTNAQTWNLVKIDSTKEYPYEYWSNGSLKDSSYYQEKVRGLAVDSLELVIVDKYGNPIPNASVRTYGKNKEKVYQASLDGKLVITKEKLDSIQISFLGYRDILFSVNRQMDSYLVTLGFGESLTICQISAKRELTVEEFKQVSSCVFLKTNTVDCSQKGLYTVAFHL